jgi:hypothetical protein
MDMLSSVAAFDVASVVRCASQMLSWMQISCQKWRRFSAASARSSR